MTKIREWRVAREPAGTDVQQGDYITGYKRHLKGGGCGWGWGLEYLSKGIRVSRRGLSKKMVVEYVDAAESNLG